MALAVDVDHRPASHPADRAWAELINSSDEFLRHLMVLSIAALVLKRDPETDSEAHHGAVLNRHVLPDHLGDPQVTHRLGRDLDRVSRGRFPGVATRPNYFGHAIHAVCHRSSSRYAVGLASLHRSAGCGAMSPLRSSAPRAPPRRKRSLPRTRSPRKRGAAPNAPGCLSRPEC